MTELRTLVLGDVVVPLGGDPMIRDGAVIMAGPRIAEVAPRCVLEEHGPFDRSLGGAGYVVMPGFVNAHYHSECWTARGLIGTVFEVSNLFIGAGPPTVDEEVLELLATWALVMAARGARRPRWTSITANRPWSFWVPSPCCGPMSASGYAHRSLCRCGTKTVTPTSRTKISWPGSRRRWRTR